MRDSDIILFMKIGRREHLQSMQNGILRFNPLEIYRVIENETHVKGRGDEYEGTLVITDINITLQRHDNGETITFHADSINYQNDAYSKLPILCLSYIDDQNLEVRDETDKYIDWNIIFSDDQKRELRKFGDSVLVILANVFINKLREVLLKHQLKYIADRVDYYDFSINDSDRIQRYIQGNPKAVFCKDKFFEPQKEFRILILNKEIKEAMTIDIGAMTDYSALLPLEDFLEGGFGLKLNFANS